jgi:[acyl-carrier-protein] S-malonyltransferase
VIAGSYDGVEAASKHARELGAKKVMALPVSGAFHTSFMAAARDRLRDAIAAADIRDAEIPVVSNVDAKPHDRGPEWTALLSAQLSSPVRWKQCLQMLAALGVTEFAELGPGGVLTGMAKRSVVGARTISVATPEDLDKLLEWVGGDAAVVVHPEGEHLFAVERLVVSPSAGIFSPVTIESGSLIDVGTLLGHVGENEVRSPFRGVLQSFIAVDTERVTPRQPIAWLRSD